MSNKQKLKSVIRLIERSPDIGEGWRSVSPMLMRGLIEPFEDQTLIEWEKDGAEGGRVRLTDKGRDVLPYL